MPQGHVIADPIDGEAPDDRALPAPPDSTQPRFTHGLSARSDLIRPQDWAALSDAFANQLRLQHERSESLASATTTDAERDDASPATNPSDQQPRTYLELRDAMGAM